MSQGTSFGAFSLIKSKIEPWSVYAGIPCKKIKDRSKNLINLENEFIKDLGKVNSDD